MRQFWLRVGMPVSGLVLDSTPRDADQLVNSAVQQHLGVDYSPVSGWLELERGSISGVSMKT